MEMHTRETPVQPVQTDINNQKTSLLRDVVVFALAASTAFLMYSHFTKPSVDEHSNIIVVDFTKIVSAYPVGASIEEVEKLMVRTNESILRLKEAGYLVIDSSAVLAAPDYLFLPELDTLMDDTGEAEAAIGAQ